VMKFSASITRACAFQTIRTTYVRTHVRTNVPNVSSTMSRHSGAETKEIGLGPTVLHTESNSVLS